MASEKDVLMLIRENMPFMSKGHKKIAEYVLDRYDEAAFITAAKVGAKVGVSESTVVRFATSIGFEGYPEYQKALAECIRGRLSRVQKMGAVYGNSSQSEIVTSVLSSDIEKIRDTIENLNPDAFDMAVNLLLEAETVYIMGLRSNEPLASFLHFYLNMIRKNVVLINSTSMTETFEQMLRINDKDCFVGISFPRYSMRTLKAMEFANDKNAKIIAITDTIHSPMNLYSSCNLLARSDMVSIVDSLVAPLSVINALVVALCLKNQDAVNKYLNSLEGVWNDYQVYLSDEINFIDEEPMINYSLRKQEEKKYE